MHRPSHTNNLARRIGGLMTLLVLALMLFPAQVAMMRVAPAPTPTAVPSHGPIVPIGHVPGWVTTVIVQNRMAYIINAGTLQILDVSRPDDIQALGNLGALASPRKIQFRGGLIYIADYTAGLRILDVTQPLTPTLLSTF